MQTADRRALIGTNVLIYATLRDDPRFARSQELLIAPLPEARCVPVQNLAEMYPNLTGPKMIHPDDPSVARAKINSNAALLTRASRTPRWCNPRRLGILSP
jgi:predicted nucleic acid-binding protein